MAQLAHDPAEDLRALLAGARQEASFEGTVQVGAHGVSPGRILEALAPLLTERRRARIDAVVAGRTRTVVPVVEGLVNTGNVSAVLRTAEALGYQTLHLITSGLAYKHSERTSQGAEKWIDVWPWETPAACADHLRARGYRIVATHLDETAVPIGTLDFTQKTALVFGNERDGVTPELLARSDQRCLVPMTGFTQSFNISVAAALCLYHAYRDRLARQGYHGDLSRAEQEHLRARYYVKSVKHAERVLQSLR